MNTTYRIDPRHFGCPGTSTLHRCPNCKVPAACCSCLLLSVLQPSAGPLFRSTRRLCSRLNLIDVFHYEDSISETDGSFLCIKCLKRDRWAEVTNGLNQRMGHWSFRTIKNAFSTASLYRNYPATKPLISLNPPPEYAVMLQTSMVNIDKHLLFKILSRLITAYF